MRTHCYLDFVKLNKSASNLLEFSKNFIILEKISFMNLTTDDVKEVLSESTASFYFIIFAADNGALYGWKGDGFELVVSNQPTGAFSSAFAGGFGNGFIPYPANVAENVFYEALDRAKTLPFNAGHLSISGLPNFATN
jgi:hypothetical protein